jgi:hypothetical protein
MDAAGAFIQLYRREGESVLLFLTRRTWDGKTALELTAETFAVGKPTQKLRDLARVNDATSLAAADQI